MMRELFGDVATGAYKKQIQSLQSKVDSHEERMKTLLESNEDMESWVDEANWLIHKLWEAVNTQNLDDSAWGAESGMLSSP